MSKVAILKTSPKTVLEDYARLLDLINYKKALPNTQDLVIKLNLSWSLYFPSCSTEPWQLEGVLNKLTQENYTKINIVENKTVVTDVAKGAINNKWLPIIQKYNQKFTPLTNVEWSLYKAKTATPAIDMIFPEGLKIPNFFKGKNIIHLPTIKTHGHTTITGAIKNAFGGLITERRHHSHKLIHEVLVDLLKIQKEIHPNILAVTDGTICGDGSGPRTMIPKIKNYILASEDQVSIDAVSAKMMGYDPLNIKFIKMAHDVGLGVGDIKQIEMVGEDISNVNFKFTTKKSPIIFWDQMFRKGSLSFVEPLLFHTGLFNLCIFASAFYHDKIWYPTMGKQRINSFMKTDWGNLFKKY